MNLLNADDRTSIAGLRVTVTGASRGIGAAIAERLASDGATVTILDIDAERGEKTAAQVGGRFFAVDLADLDSTVTTVQGAISAMGGIDVLVNNAGILRFNGILDITPGEWDRTFAINARAGLFATQVAARAMRDQGAGGSIVNIASMAAKTGGANEIGYAASKAAVVSITRSAAAELGPFGIRVNALCPGYVLTEMGAATRTDEDVAEWSKLSPLGRLGEPEDVAGFVRFLVSPDGSYLTGQAFNVTGGMITQ